MLETRPSRALACLACSAETSFLRRQRSSPSAPRTGLQPGQSHADPGDAHGGGAVVADQPRQKLIKIGAKVVSRGRYVTFQMAEVMVSRQMFQEILMLIARRGAASAGVTGSWGQIAPDDDGGTCASVKPSEWVSASRGEQPDDLAANGR